MNKYLLIAAAALLACAVAAGLFYRGQSIKANGKLDLANIALSSSQAEAKAWEHARDAEHTLSAQLAATADTYEKAKTHAQETAVAVADDLRADNIRLRNRWQGCRAEHLPATTATAGEPDATASDRAESAGRIVQAASQCDAQVRGLQSTIREYMKAVNGRPDAPNT